MAMSVVSKTINYNIRIDQTYLEIGSFDEEEVAGLLFVTIISQCYSFGQTCKATTTANKLC